MSNDHQSLIGSFVRIPTKGNCNRHWWVTVIEQAGDFIKVKGGSAAGRPWWTHRRHVSNQAKPTSSETDAN